MGKKKSSSSYDPTIDMPDTSTIAAPKAPEPKAAAPKAPIVVVMNFDRWFSSTGKPAHHKSGMKTYRKTAIKGKRTAAAWQELFKNY